MEFYSHVFFNENNKIEKRKLLDMHLNEVYEFFKNNLPRKFIDNLISLGYKEEDIQEVIRVISFCHDFGKFNRKFQVFINLNPEEKNKFKDTKLKEHSLLSSLFGFFIAKNIFNNDDKKSIFLKSLIFYLIKQHHSNLGSFADEMHIIDNLSLINKQMGLIDDYAYLFYSEKFCVDDIKNKFKLFIAEIPNQDNFVCLDFDIFKEILPDENKDFSTYFVINTFFSILHDADVHSASDICYTPEKITSFEFIREHIKNISTDSKEINKERTEIFWKLDSKAQEIDLSKRIYQITSPTGSGKTLSSLNFALQLKKRLKDNSNYKIIYSIPFTSIIDQTFDIFSKLLKDNNLSSNTLLLRHHHLTDTSNEVYKNETETYVPPELNSIIVESWNCDLIVTTFIQLFESIITNNKEMIKKVHNIYNSIIIIDECQNIPVKYWEILKEFLSYFSRFFDTYLIFLTATQPLIFNKNEENSPVELLDDYKKYFLNKARTELIPLIEEKDLEQFYTSVRDIILENNFSSILIVLNTVKDSQDIFKLIEEDTLFFGYKKIYLSASLIPLTKLGNIKRIKKLNKQNKTSIIKDKYIAVTTQLIEAGVDIDNDVIFRDIAPFENLIQTAGRCNREGERIIEKVFVFNIKKNEKQRASTIYPLYLLNVTEKILKNSPTIIESNYLNIFEKYIQEKRGSSNMTLKLEESIQTLNYNDENRKNEPISSFRIINQKVNRVSCFINLNDESQLLLNKYNEIKKIRDIRIKIKKWLPFKNRFQMYIVEIPEKIVQSKVNDYFAKYQKKPKLLILDKEEWENYYDKTLGYIDLDYIWV